MVVGGAIAAVACRLFVRFSSASNFTFTFFSAYACRWCVSCRVSGERREPVLSPSLTEN